MLSPHDQGEGVLPVGRLAVGVGCAGSGGTSGGLRPRRCPTWAVLAVLRVGFGSAGASRGHRHGSVSRRLCGEGMWLCVRRASPMARRLALAEFVP